MSFDRSPARRGARLVLGFALLAALVLAAAPRPRAAQADRVLLAIPNPGAAVLQELAGRDDTDVRWVERGLVLCELESGALPPARWRAQVLARPAPGLELGILRGAGAAPWRKPGPEEASSAQFLAAARVARLEARAGEVWVLLAEPGAWPEALLGGHGGIVLARHHVDPRSLLDAGPPSALRPWLDAGPRALTPAEQRLQDGISADSLQRHLELLALDPSLRPADRYVFNADLDALYSARVEAVMQAAIAGIPGAEVRRQSFLVRRGTAGADTNTTYNVVAHLPGSVPGTGTFVVGAHVDATGQRDSTWLAAVNQGLPVQTPGAEDNGTGVTCVLELLRCVADGVRRREADFAFDLEFVAFSAEEIGLVGSEHYVEQAGDSITPFLGTFNFDMVGYDSVVGNLQVVHNPASRWLAELVRDATTGLVPPSALVPTVEMSEGRDSDHNSFWYVNAPAILLADASPQTLRGYATYHTPYDTIHRPAGVATRIQIPKLVEVSRAVLAALLRFDMQVQAWPRLVFAPEDLRLWITVGGRSFEYAPGYHHLCPGSPLRASLVVHNLGAPYGRSARIELESRGRSGGRVFYDSDYTDVVYTGGQIAIDEPVPIDAGDAGTRSLLARVTWDSAAVTIVRTASAPFAVGSQFRIRPAPVRGDASSAEVGILGSDTAGELRVEIFDLEGQRVAESTRRIIAMPAGQILWVPLSSPTAGSTWPGLASGTYQVRIRTRADDGRTAESSVPLVVIR